LDGYKKMLADQEAKPFVKPEIYGEVIYKDFIAEPDAKAKEFLNKWLAENNGSLTS
jgi:hypothetical protein